MRDGSRTRSRLQREALRLFVEKGVAETSIRDIAHAVGVAEGALYRHFKGKDDLVFDLFASNYVEFAATLARLEEGAEGTRAKLDAMIQAFCRFYDEDSHLFRFLLFVQHGQLDKLPAGIETPFDVICRVIKTGMRREEVPRGDLDLATAMVIGLVLQSATAAVYGRLRGPLSRHASRLASAAWAVLTSR